MYDKNRMTTGLGNNNTNSNNNNNNKNDTIKYDIKESLIKSNKKLIESIDIVTTTNQKLNENNEQLNEIDKHIDGDLEYEMNQAEINMKKFFCFGNCFGKKINNNKLKLKLKLKRMDSALKIHENKETFQNAYRIIPEIAGFLDVKCSTAYTSNKSIRKLKYSKRFIVGTSKSIYVFRENNDIIENRSFHLRQPYKVHVMSIQDDNNNSNNDNNNGQNYLIIVLTSTIDHSTICIHPHTEYIFREWSRFFERTCGIRCQSPTMLLKNNPSTFINNNNNNNNNEIEDDMIKNLTQLQNQANLLNASLYKQSRQLDSISLKSERKLERMKSINKSNLF